LFGSLYSKNENIKGTFLSVCSLTVSFNHYNFLGKRAFIAGVADDNGYGWAIAKALAAAGAEILVGTWVPVC
jgi:hypothetical protein